MRLSPGIFTIFSFSFSLLFLSELIFQHTLFPFQSLGKAVSAVGPYFAVSALSCPALADISIIDTPPLYSMQQLREMEAENVQMQTLEAEIAQQQESLNQHIQLSQQQISQAGTSTEGNMMVGQAAAFKFDSSVAFEQRDAILRLQDSIAKNQEKLQRLRTHGTARHYDILQVLEWLITRADLVVFIASATSLEFTPETNQVMERLLRKNTVDKVRFVLNKCDQLSPRKLEAAKQTFAWAMGRNSKLPFPPPIYSISLLPRSQYLTGITKIEPYSFQFPSDSESFKYAHTTPRPDVAPITRPPLPPQLTMENSPEAMALCEETISLDMSALLHEFSELPRVAVQRRVNEMFKRARLLRAISVTLAYIRDESSAFRKESKKKEVCE